MLSTVPIIVGSRVKSDNTSIGREFVSGVVTKIEGDGAQVDTGIFGRVWCSLDHLAFEIGIEHANAGKGEEHGTA